MRKIILIELNEVPSQVVEYFCKNRPNSSLAKMLSQSRKYETFTEDVSQLDPWISWPTFHRGVIDEKHNIYHLGQASADIDNRYPPVWRLLKQQGLNVGVFGSLHSSCIPDDVAEYCFYLPDYFDNDAFAHPSELLPFQELNLAMTRQSARNVSRKIPVDALIDFLLKAPQLGLTISTSLDTLSHLVQELRNRSLRIRRRAYQPLIMADLFMKQVEKNKPDFATFYTNHVAAAMHRYWGATFPEDYGDQPMEQEWIHQYKNELLFAMDKFDIMLNNFVKFVNRSSDYTLVVASSMGQAAIPAKKTYEFLTIVNLERFMSALGIALDEWEARPAMVPCLCALINKQAKEKLVQGLRSLKINNLNMIENSRPVVPMSYDVRDDGFFHFFIQFDNYRGSKEVFMNGKSLSFELAGLGMMAHEDGVNCTAQHVKEGTLFIYTPQGERLPQLLIEENEKISTLDFVPSILKHYNVPIKSYMMGKASIELAS
jgi:Type I phosphodiesterase / nucleotide pyrophosphatase